MLPELKITLDIANSIKEENVKSKDRIPTSENFLKKLGGIHGKPEDEIQRIIEQLKETHFIFEINLVQSDPALYVQGIEGYVFADQSILMDLKHFSENKLTQLYETSLFKKKSSSQVIKELYPKIKEYNNTPLGRCLNECVMLDDFVKKIEANAFEYTDSWRKEKLFKLYREENPGQEMFSYDEYIRPEKKANLPTGKWARAINQFSIKFLVRIHFRKYEFNVIRLKIIEGKISNIEDLIYIRNTLRDLEKMLDKDIILKYHLEKMIELRRLVQAKINIIRKDQEPKDNE